MTQSLDEALTVLAKLPAPEQDVLAAILLQEIASERQWADSFAKSQDILAGLAGEALAEHAGGRTKPFPSH